MTILVAAGYDSNGGFRSTVLLNVTVTGGTYNVSTQLAGDLPYADWDKMKDSMVGCFMARIGSTPTVLLHCAYDSVTFNITSMKWGQARIY